VEETRDLIFIPIKPYRNNKIKVNFIDQNKIKRSAFLETLFDKNRETKYIDICNYLMEQFRLFSDLTLGRNYLWKSYLGDLFPMSYVFEKIFDKNINLDLRGVFCDLALTIYIDHEPLNEIHVPRLCHLYKTKSNFSIQKLSY